MGTHRILLYTSLLAWIGGGLLLAMRWWLGWALIPPIAVLLPVLLVEGVLLSQRRAVYSEEPTLQVGSGSVEIVLSPIPADSRAAGLVFGWSLFLVAWILALALMFPAATAGVGGLLALGALGALVALLGREQGARYRSRLLIDHGRRTLLVGAADALLPLGEVMDVVVAGGELQIKTLDACHTLPTPGASPALLRAAAAVLREQATPLGGFQSTPADREAMSAALSAVRGRGADLS